MLYYLPYNNVIVTMAWNRGSQGVSPKKRKPRKKPAARLARKKAMLAERKSKKRK